MNESRPPEQAFWRPSSSEPPPLVRVKEAKGAVVGLGVVLNRTLVLTCAHVVAYALRLRPDVKEKPAARVDFTFLYDDSARVTADIVHWEPLAAESGDFALLEFNEPAPPGLQLPQLSCTTDLFDLEVQAYGYPKESGGSNLRWASGRLSLPLLGGWVQIVDNAVTGYRIQPGYSGTALFTNDGRVVGVVVAAEPDITLKVSAAIPLHRIRNVLGQHMKLESPSPAGPPEFQENLYKELRKLEAEHARLNASVTGLGEFAPASDRVRLSKLSVEIRSLKSKLAASGDS